MSIVHAAYPTHCRVVDNLFETWNCDTSYDTWCSPISNCEETTTKSYPSTPALSQYMDADIWYQPQIIPTLTSMHFPQQQWLGSAKPFAEPELDSRSPESPSPSMKTLSKSTEAHFPWKESSVPSEDARRARRRAQNREAQRAYRARKEKASNEYVTEMRKIQQEIKTLKDFNRQLRSELYLLKKQVAKAAMW